MTRVFLYMLCHEALSSECLSSELWALVGSHKSVKDAVPPTYEAELIQFIAKKESHAARVLDTTSG